MKILNGTVFLPDQGFVEADLELDGDTIQAIHPRTAQTPTTPGDVDATGLLVLPGLVDVHLHGAMGADTMDAAPNSLKAIEDYEVRHGVTTILPTTMTEPKEKIDQALKAAAQYVAQNPDTAIRGMHLEGPYISPQKKGAQDEKNIQTPSAEQVRHWLAIGNHLPKLITIAPEQPGALNCIREMANDIHASIGHTSANYEEAKAGFKSKADHVTHLYNAMPPFTHKEPGVIGAAVEAQPYVELICDGKHVKPAAILAAFRLFDHICLISDSCSATGMPEGQYKLGTQDIFVTEEKDVARLTDGTTAASITNLYDCMLRAIDFGIPAETAINAASLNPAKSVGLDDLVGSIEVGKRADLLIVDREYNLKVVLQGGQTLKK